jgi:hypothetical protein
VSKQGRIPILHDKIPHRIRLHRRQPDKVGSAECGICQNALEDDFHLFVGGRLKWCVWQKALQELCLDSILQTKDQVWMSLLLDQKKQAEGWQPPILPCSDHVVHLKVPLAVHNRGYNLVGGSLFG